MIKQEEIEFCEDNAISIEKFVSENFVLTEYTTRKNKKNRKWRVKHEELTGMPNIITVPIPFAHRYKELVASGKLIIVKDGFGKYKVYINPRIIIESSKLDYLEECLENLQSSIAKSSESEIEYIERRIASIEENIRIIKHFNNGVCSSYSSDVVKYFDNNPNGMSRKRVDSNKKMWYYTYT